MACSLLFAVLAAVPLFLLASSFRQNFSKKALIDGNDCQPEPRFKQSRWLCGLDMGYMLQQWIAQGVYLHSISETLTNYGTTLSINVLGQRMIWTSDPDNLCAMLATRSHDFERSKHMQDAAAPVMPNGLVYANGEVWAHDRALLRPAFSRAQVADLDHYERHFQDLLSRIPSDGSTVDLQALFHHYTIDTASELLLGKSLHTLGESASSQALAMEEAFDDVNTGILHRVICGPLMFLHRSAKFNKSVELVKDFFNTYIDEAIQRQRSPDPQEAWRKYMPENLQRYVFLRALVEDTSDRDALRDQLVTLLIAGRDTTASLMALVFHFLVRHDGVMQILRADVNALEGRIPTYAELQGMDYLRFVIRGTQRLIPTIATLDRAAVRDTYLPLGGGPDRKAPVFVAKGQVIQSQIYALHHSRELWGPDAEEYKPGRWKDLKPGWKFVPFGGGPRICPGQQLALNEITYVVVRLLQTFSRLEGRDERPFVEDVAVTIQNRNGCKVALHQRGG